MIKEIKYFFFIFVIFSFILLTGKFYFSDTNKKNSYRSLNDIDNKIDKFSKKLPILEDDTKNIIEYVEKSNNKIIVANGKSVVIKTNKGSYYRYSIKTTPLNYILDKNFLIKEIQKLNERIIDEKFINFTILKDKNEINIFFDIRNFDLIGWQTIDIYQNLNITYLSSLKKNQKLKKDIFILPEIN